MSIGLAMKVLALEERIAALERTQAADPRRLVPLYAQARARKAQGEALKAEVRQILSSHQGPRRLKAFAVMTQIRRDPPPSVRRVQEIIREIKRETGGIAHPVANIAQPSAIR